MKFINKLKKIWNENTILCLFALVLITIVIIFLLMILPMYAKSGDKYGNRLAGIKDVKIDNDLDKDVKDIFKDNESIKKVDTVLKGKIYNVLITLNDNSNVNDFIASAESVVDTFTTEQLNYYDIQIFITSKLDGNDEEEGGEKTIVGYRNNSREYFSWTNNR